VQHRVFSVHCSTVFCRCNTMWVFPVTVCGIGNTCVHRLPASPKTLLLAPDLVSFPVNPSLFERILGNKSVSVNPKLFQETVLPGPVGVLGR